MHMHMHMDNAVACRGGGSINKVCDSGDTMCDAIFVNKGKTCVDFCEEIGWECISGADQNNCSSGTFEVGCNVESNKNGGTEWGNTTVRCRCRRTCGVES